MTKEDKKNNIIGLIIVLLIGGGVYYSKSSSFIKPVEDSPSAEVPVKDGPSGEAVTTPEKPAVDTSASDAKAKWNTAMTNASNAFNKKDYPKALSYYKEALSYLKTDTVYSGMFNVYGAQGDWANAKIALDSAISLNPLFTDYWISKLVMMDEKTNATFAELKKVYTDGLTKVDPKYRVNLATNFAGIAENNKQYGEAVSAWQKAIELYPANKAIYQAEIDRLKAL